MIEMVVLVLYLNSAPIEYMGHIERDSGWQKMTISDCLRYKRTIKRNGWQESKTGNTRYSCELRQVTLGQSWDNKEIVKSIH
tara:strand:+ start:455 stop:700 length:246 start_codon:yes stop_codon:yes gene_type:complete